METYKAKEIISKTVWEKFILSQNPQTFLHSWNWGETSKILGDKVYRIGFYKGSKLCGAVLLLVQKAKRGPHLIIPGGPFINWKDKKLVSVFIKTIEKIASQECVWFIRIRPEVLDSKDNREYFRKLGFIRAPMHLHAENTWVLDISDPEDQILSKMRKNTRYSVRKSLNEGFEFSKNNSEKGIHILYLLQKDTVKRHKFLGFSEKLFSAQMKTFGDDGQMDLYTVTKGGKNYVAAMIIYYGNYAYYHHSASSMDATKTNASYFMQWNIIKTAKKKGIKYYNFWGIAPADAKKHRFMGVTTFKKGFGGIAIDWVPAQDYVISKYYIFTKVIETLRKRIRGL